MTVWFAPNEANPVIANGGWSIFNQTTLSALLNSSSNLALGTAAAAPSNLALLASTGKNVVTNGGFEDAAGLSGWDSKNSSAASIADKSLGEGSRLLTLGGSKAGEVAQDIKTEKDSVYTLSFTTSTVSVTPQAFRVQLNASGASAEKIEDRTFTIAGTVPKTCYFTFRALSDLTNLRLSTGVGKAIKIDDVRLVKTGSGDVNYIENGDFEDGDRGSGNTLGWTIESGSAGIQNDYTRAMSGNRLLALGGWTDAASSVTQKVVTEAGAVYSLSFGMHANVTDQDFSFEIVGERNDGGTPILSDAVRVANNTKMRMNYTFMAQSSSTTLRFKTGASVNGDLDLDDVRLVKLGDASEKISGGVWRSSKLLMTKTSQ